MENITNEQVQARVTELEEALARREAELTQAAAKVARLESTLTERESELAATGKSKAAAEEKLSETGKALREAVAGYRTLVLQLNPGITEELVGGDSITAIDESLAKANALVGKVRQSVEKEMAKTRVPIGSPGRLPPDVSSLSPREKINYAIGGKK